MDKIYGLILNREEQLVIHDRNCKDFISPRVSMEDRMQYDSAYIDKFYSDINIDSVEEKKNLLIVLSDNLWGGDSLLTEIVYMKCTGLVHKKKVQIFFCDDFPTSYEEARESLFNNNIKLLRETMYIKGDYNLKHYN